MHTCMYACMHECMCVTQVCMRRRRAGVPRPAHGLGQDHDRGKAKKDEIPVETLTFLYKVLKFHREILTFTP